MLFHWRSTKTSARFHLYVRLIALAILGAFETGITNLKKFKKWKLCARRHPL
jgi:hypothetical protein